MDKVRALDLIKSQGIVAVIRLSDLSQAERLCETLLAGGIRALEFTLTNPDSFDVVANLRKKMPIFDSGEAIIGLGSIRTVEQIKRSIDVGAQILVSPVLLHEMIRMGHDAGVLTAPAAFTPTEIETAHRAGADLIKVFPADTLGVKYIKNVLAPMPDLRLMPTGGVSLSNISDYLKAGVIGVGVGSALVNQKQIADGDWQAIEASARHFVLAAGAVHAD